MKKINADLKYLILLLVISILAITTAYGHYGHLLIDCGREAYYPTQILLGKVLYKDIFNIYGPFSYMLNAFLFKIFAVNLNVLYIAGSCCAVSIVCLIYLIAKDFLPRLLSFAIAFLTISVGLTNTHLFNFVFPYSYGILYGLTAFLMSFWCLIKYRKSPTNTHFFYLSSFFAGICVVSKYEFFPYVFVILYSMFQVKRFDFKQYYYAFFALLFVPIFCFGVLFLQGLRVNDLILTVEILKKMSQSQTLKYFYLRQGVYFSPQLIAFGIKFSLMTAFAAFCFIYGFKTKNKISAVLLVGLSAFFMAKVLNPLSFASIPILILIFAIFDFKNLKENTALQLLVFSSLVFGLKVFWGLIVQNYGVFFISFLLITFLALILDKFKDKNINHKAIAIFIIYLAVIIGYQNFEHRKNHPIETPRGKIFTDEYLYFATQSLVDYINKNTKKTDSVVILPEGAMINFLTDRPGDNFYTSLIPLYVEVFGEDKIIEHFKKNRPEYIVFDNWDTKDYYLRYICKDYAVSICNFVAENYTQEQVIDESFRYLIFKLRK